jgi:ribonuclease HI
MTSPARYVAITDGSCLRNPGGPGGTGFIVFDRSCSALRFGGNRYVQDGEYTVTNNRMELRSVLEALEGLPDGESVQLLSDSRYVIDALTKWIHGWRRKGWRTAEGTPVLNRDLIEAIDVRFRALRVECTWVRGHAGNRLNELADGLAQAAARNVPGPEKHEIVPALKVLL